MVQRRQTTPEQVTIFTDAQAAIRRMALEEPGPRSNMRSGKITHRHTAEGEARHHHRDSVVLSPQGSCRQ